MKKMLEAISAESDLLLKLKPLSEVEIFDFMKNLRGGTYFNMGMYSIFWVYGYIGSYKNNSGT